MTASITATAPSSANPFSTFDRAAALPCGFIRHDGYDISTQPLHRMPLVPVEILKSHHCFIETDTRFRSAARLLQSLWRQDQNLPIGLHHSPGDKPVTVKLGSRLDPAAARAGRNFVSSDVHAFVRHQLILREENAMIDEDRLHANLLSSMPLAFNLLGPLALDLDLATRVLQPLLPSFVHTVRSIAFEHSPGRGDPGYLADGTAFDAIADIITPDGEPATLFIEVKYSESMTGPAATPRPRYDETSRQVRLFRDPDSPELRSVALEQLWREHMLAQLAVDRGAANKAVFVAIGPRLNRRVAAAFRLYADQLADVEPEDELRVPFIPLTLEAIIEAIAAAGAVELAQQLHGRYLAFHRVLAIALAPPPAVKSNKPRRRPASSSAAAQQPSKPKPVPAAAAMPTARLAARTRSRPTSTLRARRASGAKSVSVVPVASSPTQLGDER